MKFGMSASKIDEVGLAVHAENLGYDFCWVTDSPVIRSEPFSILALAAQQTRTIRLGTGLIVPALRQAPVVASGIATINRLAPGRTFLGMGTGNTAMRTLGQRPMPIARFSEYVKVVQALLRGEEVEYTHAGVTAPVQFQNQELNYWNLEHPIPIHLGGLGPKAQTLAGEIADGLVTSLPRGGTVSQALTNVRAGAAKSGRSLDGFETFALANLLLLEPGETLSSPRAIGECGSAIMANVHYLVDLHLESGVEPPEYIRPIWDDYLAFHMARSAEARQRQMHQSHYSYLDPDEARFITPEMIRNFCLAGQPEEIAVRLAELQAEGLDAVAFIFPLEQTYRLLEDFARQVMPLVA